MKRFIIKELEALSVFSVNARRLIIANMVFACAFPFLTIFSAAFVNRATNNPTLVSLNAAGFAFGMILGYFLNGLLLRKRVDIRYIFSTGMILSMLSTLLLIFSVDKETGLKIIFYGILVGTGNGIYWSSRSYLTMLSTDNKNRNLYTGIEQFYTVFFNAIIPLIFGTLIIGLGQKTGLFTEIQAYKSVAVVLVLIMLGGSVLIIKSSFQTPLISNFLYFRYNRTWNRMRVLSFIVGSVQSCFWLLIPLLILTIAGDEKILGKIEFFTALISVVVIYILGRNTLPHHRGKVMFVGTFVIMAGAILNAFFISKPELALFALSFSFLGVIAMKIAQVIGEPMINSTFGATLYYTAESSAHLEKRDSYTYIMDNEFFFESGKICGAMLFVIIISLFSTQIGLKYVFLFLGSFQFISAYITHTLNKHSS